MTYKDQLTAAGWVFHGKECSCTGGKEKYKKGNEMIRVKASKNIFYKIIDGRNQAKPLSELHNFL